MIWNLYHMTPVKAGNVSSHQVFIDEKSVFHEWNPEHWQNRVFTLKGLRDYLINGSGVKCRWVSGMSRKQGGGRGRQYGTVLRFLHHSIDFSAVRSCCITVDLFKNTQNVFLKNTHNRHPICCPHGQYMGCLLQVQTLHYIFLMPWLWY